MGERSGRAVELAHFRYRDLDSESWQSWAVCQIALKGAKSNSQLVNGLPDSTQISASYYYEYMYRQNLWRPCEDGLGDIYTAFDSLCA